VKTLLMLPRVQVGVGAAPPRPVGLGDTSSALDNALTDMVNDFAAHPCPGTASLISTFQTAYNAWLTPGGGMTPVAVNGAYDAPTQAAAAFANTTEGLNLTIPPACGGGVATAQMVNLSLGGKPSAAAVLGIVAVAAIGGVLLWHHDQASGHGRSRPRLVHRRRRAR